MALIKCHECSNGVSDHARTCPKCGAPVIATIKRNQKNYLIWLGIRVAVVLVLIVIVKMTLNKVFAPFKTLKSPQVSVR